MTIIQNNIATSRSYMFRTEKKLKKTKYAAMRTLSIHKHVLYDALLEIIPRKIQNN